MLFLIIAGLDQMDLLHIALLIFFVAYTLYGDKLKNMPLYLLFYVEFFVLEKYIFTLVYTNWDDEPPILTVLGLDTPTYAKFITSTDPSREYFRYVPSPSLWILVFLSFCLYRRSVLVQMDEEKVLLTEKKAKTILSIKFPTMYRIGFEIEIIWTYIIVAVAFIFFISVILLQKRTIINGGQQLIVLILICVYYARGLESLIGKWEILIASTSLVLLLQIAYQFGQQTGIWKRVKTNNPQFFAKLPVHYDDWLRAIGFYNIGDEPTFAFFLPYILLFSFSVLLYRVFKKKLAFEKQDITFDDEEVILLTDKGDDNFADQRKGHQSVNISGEEESEENKNSLVQPIIDPKSL